MQKLLLFSLIGLVALSCQKTEDAAPTPTLATTCQLDGFTDFAGNEAKINGLDAEGRIAQVSLKQVEGQVLTIVSTFTYETNGQLKGGNQTISENGRLLASQPLSFTYTSGLLTAMESRCGCPQNLVGQHTTFRYNPAKQLIEKNQESPGSPDKYVTAYTYDAAGNVLKATTKSDGQTLFDVTYTYDGAKHPHQLLKGLPLNLLAGAEPWKVNVPLTIKAEFVDENGQKQTQESTRTDLKANTKGYVTSVSFGSGPAETFTLKNCD